MTRYIMVTAAGETEITPNSAKKLNLVHEGELWQFIYVTAVTGKNIKVNPYQVIMVREEQE